MDHYQITLAPELGVTPQELAEAWNASAACRAVAEAAVGRPKGAQFDPSVAVMVLSGLALGVAGNALYDLLKELLIRQGVRRRTKIVQVEQPDGTRLLVVTVEE
jgi:hypothetical protein